MMRYDSISVDKRWH